ncbi:hypothetical protein [Halotalea alkalilenta]|uniref:Uncharacterized protein n=1 Tax=Halotalea alkalilenta TaxID=376489 RepID=A0A172YH96_9GAMM|nr:hypothetical protein [Halotalea alkalilenta]ANF58486.1 hypothetical protein A5892_14220 [Halotalea alkalilenta]
MGIPLPQTAKVIDFESMRDRFRARQRIIRLAPEHDGLEMIYRLASDSESLYGMPVLAWALQDDGQIVGMVPWMDKLTPCHTLDDPEHGSFVGFRDPETQELLEGPPEHKIHELEHASLYFDYESTDETTLIQHLPDTQGTHALCLDDEDQPWLLKQVHGWRLYSDGAIEALLLDESQLVDTPVLPGDDCLYPGSSRHAALYFFQRTIANRIKRQDPDTLEALAMMVNSGDD